MAGNVVSILNRSEFRAEVLQWADPVLVLFSGADGHSKKLDRTLPTLAGEFDGRAKFAMVDVTVADLLAADHGVRPQNVPTMVLFLNGRAVQRWGNEQNPEVYRKALEQAFAHPKA